MVGEIGNNSRLLNSCSTYVRSYPPVSTQGRSYIIREPTGTYDLPDLVKLESRSPRRSSEIFGKITAFMRHISAACSFAQNSFLSNLDNLKSTNQTFPVECEIRSEVRHHLTWCLNLNMPLWVTLLSLHAPSTICHNRGTYHTDPDWLQVA